MKLTPLDIRKHEFASKLRGYDPEEVVAFNEMVSRQWEELLDELRHARDRVRELEGKIEHYEKVESALHEALQTARSGAKRTQEHAEERARLIVEEAELRAEQILQEADQRQGRLRHDITNLTHRHDEITARLRHFLMSELEILARHEEDRPIGFMQLMPSTPAEALPTPPAGRSEPAPRATIADPAPASSLPDAAAPEDDAETTEPRGSTYGDLYARAAEAESQREPDAPEPDETESYDDGMDDEPAWTLRSIVNQSEADASDNEAESTTDSEKERIRRILEDLD
ncbi:MAG: DivIVA domain-containing protein [Rhodothermales bacterium]